LNLVTHSARVLVAMLVNYLYILGLIFRRVGLVLRNKIPINKVLSSRVAGVYVVVIGDSINILAV